MSVELCPTLEAKQGMARAKKRNYSKRSYFYLGLLLFKFLLIKIGQMPLLVTRIKLPVFQLPKISLKKSKPGRQITHFKRYLKVRITKKTRFVVVLSIFLIIFLGYTYFTFQAALALPSPTRLSVPDQPITSEFYDRNGKILYRLFEGRNRSLVKLKDLPLFLIQATIAIEDKNFYYHPGFDPLAIVRALYQNSKTGDIQGASTITQQLIKNSLLSPEQTYLRKAKEIFLAFWAERIYTKEQILQMYFNETPYGGPAWGIEAAAQTYFGKSARDLNLPEAAFLVGLPASPTEYSPFGTHPEKGVERQRDVLRRMVEDKYITQTMADQALTVPLDIKSQQVSISAPHFVMYVRDYLSRKYGSRVVAEGGLKVTTTLDLGLQEQVEGIVKDEVDKLAGLNVHNGASMVTDAKTGQILSMVGSKDYFEPNFGNFNVTLSLRQPGSSIKPITYATGFKQGYSPGNTILDSPVSFRNQGSNAYSPQNYDQKFHGPVSIRTALGSSYNIPAVKMLAMVGMDKMIQTAKDLGITTFDDSSRFGLSLTLGGGEVRMIDMMGVYAAFATNGLYHKPTPILKVTDSAGNILEEAISGGQRVLAPEVAYLITNILSDNSARTPAFGSNSLLNIVGYDVAVKTGTSDNKRDNWTFGYSPDFVVGVWVGNSDNSPMDQALTSGVTGAAPIWNRIMKGILVAGEAGKFEKPSGIAQGLIDGRQDLIATNILPKALVRVIRNSEKTTYFDAFSSYATPSAQASNEVTINQVPPNLLNPF